MAETTRPRPRPRPRPVPKAAALQSGSSSTATTSKVTEIEDDDSMFMRNQTRTTNTWTKLDKIAPVKKAKVQTGSDSDEVEIVSPRRRQKKKAGSEAPRWQEEKNFTRVFSQELSSDEDSDDSALREIENTPTSKLKRKRCEGGKRRSRSKSITPPPEIPIHQLQTARNLVRQAFAAAPRAKSPTRYEGDDSADIELDPELASIARNIKLQSHLRDSSPPRPTDSESEDTVLLEVKWKPHPLNEHGKEESWSFKLNRTDNFRDLFEAVAEEATILNENLIMSYRGNRFFPSVTPSTLKIWGNADFVACDKTTYEYIRNQAKPAPAPAHKPPKPSTSRTDSSTIEINSDDDDDAQAPSPSGAQYEEDDDEDDYDAGGAAEESESEGDKFKLVLRSTLTTGRDVHLTVRSTTTCGAIVKAFLKNAGLADQYPGFMGGAAAAATPKKAAGRRKSAAVPVEKIPQLCVDGDKVGNNSPIGDMDLEDGDIVDVVGL